LAAAKRSLKVAMVSWTAGSLMPRPITRLKGNAGHLPRPKPVRRLSLSGLGLGVTGHWQRAQDQ
jgi:hypothetical protein